MAGGIRSSIAAVICSAAVLAGCANTVDGIGVSSLASASGSSGSSGSSGAAGSVPVRDPGGHFAASMPAQPKQTSEPGSFGGYSFTVHIATVQTPYIAIVEGEVITPALPEDQLDQALRTAVSAFQSSSQLTLDSQRTTTYHGRPARSAVLSRSSEQFELLVIGYSGTQTYLLFAPKGDRFDSLLSSFRPI